MDLQTRDERRLFERFSARFPVKFKDARDDYGTEVFLRDASAQGMRILTKERFFWGDQVSLDVQLPSGGEPMVLSGTVIWVKLLDLSLWEIGIQFHHVDLLKMQRIFKLAEEVRPLQGRNLANPQDWRTSSQP
jgi:Tfp pilus assembly protein PilZ